MLSVVLTASLTGCFAAQTYPQTREVEDPVLIEVFQEIAEMGPNLNLGVIQRTEELFAKLHENSARDGVAGHRDLRYGPDPERHLLDVYLPENPISENAAGTRPVVVFVHGGGLTGGYKDNETSDLMYANIATYFARNDMVGINATYRLVPEITYPEGGEDMKAIMDWIGDNADEYDMDPDKIFFLCASAGCVHVASLIFDLDMMNDATPDIAGAIMLSGAYEGWNSDYYGTDAETMRDSAPLGLAQVYDGRPVPVFLMTAEFDPNPIEVETVRMLLTLCEKRASCPRYTQVQDHNHVSITRHINTSDERYSSQMLDFIRDVIGGQEESEVRSGATTEPMNPQEEEVE